VSPTDALLVAVGAICLANSLLIVVLFRQVGLAYLGYRPARSRDGLPEGMAVPEWNATDARGEGHSRASLLGAPAMILFAEPDCAPCLETMKELARLRDDLPSELQLLIVGTGDHETNAAFVGAYGIEDPILAQSSRDLARTFRVLATPFGFGIDSAGVVRWRGFVNGAPQMEELAAAVSPGAQGLPAAADRSMVFEGEGSKA
jgi:hypothetical protein